MQHISKYIDPINLDGDDEQSTLEEQLPSSKKRRLDCSQNLNGSGVEENDGQDGTNPEDETALALVQMHEETIACSQ